MPPLSQDTHKPATCWQYEIRQKNYEEDLKEAELKKSDVAGLTCDDFSFRIIEDLSERAEVIQFIKRHEWLGTTSQYPTHYFGCYYKDILAGALILNVPNAFTKMLGDNTPELERLISRGACISWSPKGLASKFIMWAIKYMVENTRYRLFSAYADTEAGENGTIYSACNFYYVGQNSGTTTRYINPYTGRIVSDRFFRQRATYKKFAKELKIDWQKDWTIKSGMNWKAIPTDVANRLRAYSRQQQAKQKPIIKPKKHKFCFVLGKDKRETRQLRKEFLKRNKIYPYPKRN